MYIYTNPFRSIRMKYQRYLDFDFAMTSLESRTHLFTASMYNRIGLNENHARSRCLRFHTCLRKMTNHLRVFFLYVYIYITLINVFDAEKYDHSAMTIVLNVIIIYCYTDFPRFTKQLGCTCIHLRDKINNLVRLQ